MSRIDGMLKGGMYRSRNGVFLGVCRGIAEYFDFSLFWVRFITLVLLILTGIWPTAVLYIVASFLMKPEPVQTPQTSEEKEFYHSYIHSRKGASSRLKRRYENLDRRIRRMEDVVTSREFDFERRLNS